VIFDGNNFQDGGNLCNIPKKQNIYICVGVFCTGKNMVVKITCISFEVVLQTIKHTVIYHASGPSLEVIALCLAA
jgi:hypothetical protein